MKKYILIFFIAICVTFIESCKKRCTVTQDIYSIGADMYSYVCKDTSLFIYVNSSSIIDSVIMYKEQQGQMEMDTSDACVDLEKQVFNLYYFDKLTHAQNIYFFDYHGIVQNGTGVFPNYGTIIYDRSLSRVGDSSFYIKYVAFYNMLNIQGNNIYNIKEFQLLTKNSSYPNTTYLYWAPNCGIVRTDIYDSLNNLTKWELVVNKSHILPL